jgi:protein CpxP
MNSVRKSILIGMTVFGLGAAPFLAQAQSVAPEGGRHTSAASAQQHAQQHQARRAAWAAKAAARDQKLHDALKLTAAQEGAWSAWLAARKPAARPERGAAADRGGWKALPAPQRLERQLARAKQRTLAMEARLAALTSFYGVLTPEQQKVFDASAAQRGGRHHRHHRMGHSA